MLKEVESLDFTGVKMVHIYWMASDCKANKDKLNLKFWVGEKQYAKDKSFKTLVNYDGIKRSSL